MSDPYQAPSVSISPIPPPASAPVPGDLAVVSNDEKTWASIAHFSSLTSLIPAVGIIGSVLGPLIVYLVKKDTSPFVAQEAKEALNFNITWAVGTTLLWGVSILLIIALVGFLLIPVAIVAHLAWVVLPIVGGLRAMEGRPYRYPLTVRLVQ